MKRASMASSMASFSWNPNGNVKEKYTGSLDVKWCRKVNLNWPSS